MEEQGGYRTVRKMQNYIEDHLNDKITLLDIAHSVNYSPWYCIRLFKKHLNMTPFEYVRMIRLTEAAKILRDQEVKVIDVALDFYFGSQEGFTRAFAKQFGITPKQYSIKTPPVKWFLPYPAVSLPDDKEGVSKMSQNEVAFIFTQIIEKPKRKMLIKRGKKGEEYFSYCEEVGCDIWGLLSSVKEAQDEPVGMWLPDKYKPEGTSRYVQGVEVPMDYDKSLTEGMELMVLEPCLFMVFQGRTYDDENFEQEIMMVKEAISKYDPKLYGYEWAKDDGPVIQYEPLGDRGYIECWPVKKAH